MVSISKDINAPYAGMTAEQSQAVDAQAARQLTELGGKLEDGKLVLPGNVKWEFSNDTFALTGADGREAFFKKETYDKYVSSLSGGAPVATSAENDQLINTSAYAGGLSSTSRDLLHRLFPNATHTNELQTNRLDVDQQRLLTQSLNNAGDLRFAPTETNGWTLQGVRDALVALEHPEVKGSTFRNFTPEKQTASYTTAQGLDAIQGMNQNLAAQQASTRRDDAVRASIVGINPQNAITKDDFVGFLRGKGVSDAQIDQTFMPAFQSQLDRYAANARSYYASQGNPNQEFSNNVVYAADLSRDPKILANWPV